jgi:hypoxanthine phosphoribosyltransferase
MLADIERVLFNEQTILSRLDALAAEITEVYRGEELTVVALMTGSFIFAADLLRRIPIPLRLACLQVASYHGGIVSSGRVEFRSVLLPEVVGRHVLILDDILDSGGTLAAVCGSLKDFGCKSLRVSVLLRKDRPRDESVDADFVGFEISDEFVVGYGLDYAERYRNLPFIGVLRAEVFRDSGG